MSPALCGNNQAEAMFSLLISSFLSLSLLLFLLFQHVYPGLLTDGATDVIVNLSPFVHRRDTLEQQIASYVTGNFHSPKTDISDELGGSGIIGCTKCYTFTWNVQI